MATAATVGLTRNGDIAIIAAPLMKRFTARRLSDMRPGRDGWLFAVGRFAIRRRLVGLFLEICIGFWKYAQGLRVMSWVILLWG
jgi:hypothetical protein